VPTPKHDADRNSAWAVVECAQVTRPEFIVVENVPDFANWILYANWRSCLETLGYRLQTHVLTATAFGVPQRRTRLVIVGSRKPLALRLPNGPEREPAFGPLLERRLPWRPFSQARPQGRERMLNALHRQGNRRCLVQHVTGHPGVPLREPIRTITTKRQWVLVDPERGYRWLTTRELARAQGFPESFRLPEGTTETDGARLVGNAVPPPLACGVITAVREAA
jgi:DNA (cytosine-5)-methyltransferase 1